MDGYTVLRVIGEGSFGRALLVHQESSNRMFAMKEIRLPKNVFLTQNGKVKLGDFGSARLLSNPMAFACTYVGTPYYVPPEIWENMPYNNKSENYRSDTCITQMCGSRAGEQRSLVNVTIITEYGEQILEETKKSKHSTPRKKDNKAIPRSKASSPGPLRRQWEKNASTTALAALGNAPVLTSSLTAEDSGGGCVIKYSENNTRKQWLREAPETLLSILRNADLSLAFQTYTIYRPGAEGFLKGPLSEETEASDDVDGDHDSVILDLERLEPGLDEEDTDFEEDDSPDWVSELKQRAGWQEVCSG
ncbi:serine/threonine-protein kinase Nek3 [Camelus ferus]|nr:serine/threonine-protein kinase Nek3 [Camelus ferus]